MEWYFDKKKIKEWTGSLIEQLSRKVKEEWNIVFITLSQSKLSALLAGLFDDTLPYCLVLPPLLLFNRADCLTSTETWDIK